MRHILIILLSLTLGSCTDWLDVKPEASVSMKELFTREEGFQEAINGIYTCASAEELYGGVFTMEIQDAMMQNYSFATDDYTRYARTAAFDFNDRYMKARLSAIWSTAYNAIANCNLIIENVDNDPHIFSDGIHDLVKGEALALRAYIHLDMLRFYAPSYATSPDADAIPYVMSYSNRVTPLSSVRQVIEKVIADLVAAKTLLAASDPILSEEYVVGYTDDDDATEEESKNLFLQNRRMRMNYYAVCGTLARAYLLKGDTGNALLNATEVIYSQKFPWADPADYVTPLLNTQARDRILYPELIFAWYIEQEFFNLDIRFSSTTTGYYVDKTYADNNIYELATVGGDDYRLKSWFVVEASGGTQNYKIVKYLRNPEQPGNRHYLVAPSMRLSEMYYIAAECAGGQPGWDFLNTVRTRRGLRDILQDPATGDDAAKREFFIHELLKEYRKEMYAEGGAFLAHKRLNRDIVGQNAMYPASDKIYVMPLPDDEIEFGNRKK